jgi:AhpD family alkylhydroperoxidase
MATNEQRLSTEQRELVAVGASIGAGCHPCVKYHIKAGTDAGLAGGRLLAAVTSAERVAVEAAERMRVHARAQLGAESTTPAAVSPLDDAFASFGAALAANDLANIGRHMQAASELGASRSQLQEALEVAQKVQENAARIHGREAERLLETSAPQAPSADDDGACADDCPCHADEDEATVAGVESETCATEASSDQSRSGFTPTSNRAARPARSTASVAVSADAAGPFKEMGRCCAMHGS